MNSHALLSASSSERWINCPPSAKENMGGDTGSSYAQQGTDAHALCEYKVKKALGFNVRDPTEDLTYFDEEMAEFQKKYAYCVMRQGELWWHDFLFMVKTCEDLGMRAWAWSDYAWWHPCEYIRRTPKSVLLSDWYYPVDFDLQSALARNRWALRNFIDFDNAGFDQVPTGTNYAPELAENFPRLVEFCDAHISPDRLKGYIQTPWSVMIPKYRDRVLQAVDIAVETFRNRGPLPSAAQKRYSAAENAKLTLPPDADAKIAEQKRRDPSYNAYW
jgi:hypothetical protein